MRLLFMVKHKPAKPLRRGTSFQTSISLEKKYTAQLKKMVSSMTASVRKELLDLFRKTGAKDNFAVIDGISSQTRILLNRLDRNWQHKFNEIARNLTPKMMQAMLRESKAASARNLRKLYEHNQIQVRDTSPEMLNVFKASVNQGVELIKTIPSEYFKDIKGDVMRTITGGGSLAELAKQIDKHNESTVHRASNIALDQSRKAYQGFNLTMCIQAGVKKGIWVHVDRTNNPRKKHKDFDGQEFELAKGAPVGTMKGGSNYVKPAEEPFCNCTFIPILDFE